MANKLIGNLSGGMNAKATPLILKDEECEQIINYNLDTTGALTKRPGYDVFGSQMIAARRVLGLFQYTNTATPAETTQLAVVDNATPNATVIYYNNSGTWATSKTNDTYAATRTNFNRYRFATFLNYVFRVNGTDVVGSSINVNGSAWGTTNCPATITPSFIAVYQDRGYAARSGAANGSRLYFSSLPSAGVITWTVGTDYIDINPDDGDEITALENNGNRLLIFKNRSMYRWNYGQVEPDRLIGIGTSSQECVRTNFDLGITFFANEYGAYAYSGNRPKLISRKIQKWIDAIPAADLNSMCAETDADHYYLYMSDSMTVDGRVYTNVMAVYTISLDAWVIYTLNTPARVMNKLIQSSAEDIYFGNTQGRTYKFNSGTADDSGGASFNTAANINGEILTKEYLLSFPERSTIDSLYTISNQRVEANVFYSIDRNEKFTPLGNIIKRFSSFPVGKDGNTFRVRITDNSMNTSIIEGINIETTPTKLKL